MQRCTADSLLNACWLFNSQRFIPPTRTHTHAHTSGGATDDLTMLGAVASDILRVVGDSRHESQATQVGPSLSD